MEPEGEGAEREPSGGREDPPAGVDDLIGAARRRERAGAVGMIAFTIAIVALIALAVWFFAFAHNPCCAP